MQKVFISYARADLESARRLFNELCIIENVDPWLDKESILPGAKWRPAIRKAIREANYFLALISRHSVSGRGFRNTELVVAPDARAVGNAVQDTKIEKKSRYHYRVGLVDLDLGLSNLKSIAESLNEAQSFFLFTYPQMP